MPELMRVIARLNVGGPARHVLRIERPLHALGWSTLLVAGRAGADEGDLAEEARAAGQELVVLEGLGRAIRPGRDLRAFAELRALLRRRRPALVHTHTAKAGVLGRLAAPRGPGAPVLVHSYHGHVLAGYFGRARSSAFRALERRLARRSDALVAVSVAVRDELLVEHRVGRPGQYRVIPPGFDARRAAPDRAAGAALRRELRLPPGALLVGCVGRLAPVKGVEVLLAAYPILRRAEPRAHLLVVGDGPAAGALRPAIEALPGVAWLPARDDLRAVYGALDLLAMPSRREGLPQVLAEALAAGLPVVASAVGGVPELLRDGEQGLLVPPGDAPALAAALARLCADEALRRACAGRAAATDLSAHGAQAVAARLAALYDGLLEARAGRGPDRGSDRGAARGPEVAWRGRGAQTAAECISSS